MKMPLKLFRPVRTAVNGSFQESEPAQIGVIWGELSLSGRELEINGIDINEDVAVGDIVEVEVSGNF